MLTKLLFNPITLLIVTALCLVFSFSLYKSTQKTRESTQQLHVLEQEVAGMKNQVQSLEQASEDAQQPFTKEKIIRNELLMQKPGEFVVQVPDETAPLNTQQSLSKPTPWQEWKTLLF